ncbi:MAG: hypothetical protein ACOCU4_09290, partial [Alkalispirochaeta sp.]
MHTPQTRGVVFRHPLRSATICITLLLTLFLSCQNPAGPSTDGSPDDGTTDGGTNTPVIDDEPGTGGGGGSGGSTGGDSSTGDVAPEPITITFVLDMDSGEESVFGTLTTSATAPAPLEATAGIPVRLDQGTGFTATGSDPGGPGTLTYHASGWSEEPYSTQFAKIFDPSGDAPSGDGYYLPGFEATFTEDTNLYIRWLPEYDNVAARITYREPSGTDTIAGPILHLRDALPF